MSRLIHRDPFTKLEKWHSYDSLTDTTIIETRGDYTPTLELNKVMANDDDMTKKGIKRGFWLYARFDPIIQIKLLVEHGIDIYNKEHGERLNRILEDPAYRHLKTTTKHHKFK